MEECVVATSLEELEAKSKCTPSGIFLPGVKQVIQDVVIIARLVYGPIKDIDSTVENAVHFIVQEPDVEDIYGLICVPTPPGYDPSEATESTDPHHQMFYTLMSETEASTTFISARGRLQYRENIPHPFEQLKDHVSDEIAENVRFLISAPRSSFVQIVQESALLAHNFILRKRMQSDNYELCAQARDASGFDDYEQGKKQEPQSKEEKQSNAISRENKQNSVQMNLSSSSMDSSPDIPEGKPKFFEKMAREKQALYAWLYVQRMHPKEGSCTVDQVSDFLIKEWQTDIEPDEFDEWLEKWENEEGIAVRVSNTNFLIVSEFPTT